MYLEITILLIFNNLQERFLQLFGGLLVAAGTFAFYEKWNTMGSIKLNTFSDVILNISLVLIIAGQIIFIVSFAGCIGALRENTTLLKFVSKLIILDIFIIVLPPLK